MPGYTDLHRHLPMAVNRALCDHRDWRNPYPITFKLPEKK